MGDFIPCRGAATPSAPEDRHRVNVAAQRDRVGGWASLPTRCHKAEAGLEAAGAAGRGSEQRGRDLSGLKRGVEVGSPRNAEAALAPKACLV